MVFGNQAVFAVCYFFRKFIGFSSEKAAWGSLLPSFLLGEGLVSGLLQRVGMYRKMLSFFLPDISATL
jgi:hypothetical protein